ncbi:MAG: YARHG domain-containing protein [Flammeovirgaceae bacterium]|nr:YARHG domain-containing protein [Flammeovirgaceae bacterium]
MANILKLQIDYSQKDDVENLLPAELEFMRNEIYARHGYSFKDREDRMQFDSIDWYIPMGIDIRDKLTDIEVQNIDLVYTYEEYYNESYDDYGRKDASGDLD